MKRFTIAAAFLLLVAVSRDAAAQGFISPFLGTTLSSPSDAGSHTKPGYGVAFGALGKVIGGETEIAYFPELLDNSANAIAKNKIVTFSGNTLIGPTIGRVKPYVGLGAGNLHLNVTSLSNVVLPNADFSKNYFTFNVGGGVIGFFTDHLGARGDLRYTRAFGIKIEDLATTGLSLDKFNFWRATFGLAVKF
ncbi:MAG TPA: outer membrane beta-barrel protein [Vicinamibacterales bacterium]|nr:outer membrane beta-barrel protein [Vicinamibacterales bacterium]